MKHTAYNFIEQIGRGSHGTEVWRARYNTPDAKTSEHVAIKIVDMATMSNTTLKQLESEVNIMRTTRHKHVLPYYGSYVHGSHVYLIMECLEGSVLDIMRFRYTKGLPNEAVIATTLYHVLQGLAYLHSISCIHRDIKAGNILLHRDGRIVLGDFGVSTMLQSPNQRCESFVGTLCWMAPEILQQFNAKHTTYDHTIDIWSLGITAIELALGVPPHAKYGREPMRVIQRVLTQKPPTLKRTARALNRHNVHFSKRLQKFVSATLKKKPRNRPTAERLLTLPLFDKRLTRSVFASILLAKLPSQGVRFQKHQALQRNRTLNVLRSVAQPASGKSPGAWVF